ncbi:hypothetical protein CXIVA_07900 [Clostridium sp. SY8519]|uniref:helix-turn-helix domain-containing protein n=1 Tax=Clostridium sp. (strain SY8519) TaxID=1042156 RepID=UPI0002172032|nr:helix-turn-helix domain-containing protein [Clostridium sp. SY8519]BAK46757.1 hypothetical protein CXIVA_07900 [Clostridium sp. SY8519]
MKQMFEHYPELLDVNTVADILGVTPVTVRRHIQAGNLPSIKVGRLIRIPKHELCESLEGGRVHAKEG